MGWAIAWRRGNETIKSFGIIAGVALAWLGFFVGADTPPSTLTSEPASFVPNGTGRIAFMEQWEIYVMNADGTNQTQLTDYQPYPSSNYAEISYPIWSPDGKRIAYDAGAQRGLNMMDVDGTNQIHLGSGDCPTWAP